jgi:hypothetical protein
MSVHAHRLALMKRAMLRTDAELFEHRDRLLECCAATRPRSDCWHVLGKAKPEVSLDQTDFLQAQITALQAAVATLITKHPDRPHLAQGIQAAGDMVMAQLLASGRSEEFLDATQEHVGYLVELAKGTP